MGSFPLKKLKKHFSNEFSNLNDNRIKANYQNLPNFIKIDVIYIDIYIYIYIYIKDAVKISRFQNNPAKSYQHFIKVLEIEFMGKYNRK